ncbi:MAG: Hpt domain-containing protein, partial [Pseudomonadota bacterium]|nr:Hpt domain-containing protein [Pseudomonadota bacterium]
DEDILQDFLVEAGEILEQLSEQLVDLEQRPDDNDLLNAIFRGFHTVKGGAGFLQLNEMVECCHVTENLFDILRNGKREVTPELMDVVLQALDTVNIQFEQVSQRTDVDAASPDLLAALERLVSCEDLVEGAAPAAEAPAVEATVEETPDASADSDPQSTLGSGQGEGDITDSEFEELLDAISDDEQPAAAEAPASAAAASSAPAASDGDEITEDEFEALLDELHGKGKGPAGKAPEAAAPAPAAASGSDEITEDEFDALLDQLHGKGKGPGANGVAEKTAAPSPAAGGDDLISEDEFEALLDELHGKGKAPGKDKPEGAAPKAEPAAAPAPAPAKKAEAKPAAAPAAKKTDDAKPKAAKGGAARGAGRDAGGQPAAPAGETTVRVDTQRLDDIMNMVGELVLVRNRLVRLGMKG